MKKITLAVCALFATGFIFSACSKSPLGPSMSSFAPSAAASSSTSTSTCITSGGGASTSVSTSQTNTVTVLNGDTSVSSTNGSTGVGSGITGGGSSSTGGNGTVNTGSTLNLTFHSTLVAAVADIRSITISASTVPTLSLNYNGVTGTNLWFMVNDSTTAHYMNVSVPSLPTSIRFGVTPIGGTANVPSKTLIPGTYSVVATVSDVFYNTTGYAYGTIIVQ